MSRSIEQRLRRSRSLRGLRRAYWKARFRLLSSSPAWKANAHDGLPVPPAELRFLISGIPDYPVGDFLEMGRHCAGLVQETMARHGADVRGLRAVLDFGCGCGRTLRHFSRLSDARLYGTDYNPRLIQWCRPNLPFAEFEMNQLQPPLVYGDQAFDLIYAFSVFTHLTEPLQHEWFAELTRVLRPGGYLALSTMPERLLPDDDARRRFQEGQLVIVNAADAGTNGCAAFQPHAFMEKVLVPAFEILDSVPGGVGQDFWLLRRAMME